MDMKYRLYSSTSGWNNRNSSLEEHLGIPDGEGTLRYAIRTSVTNSENSDYGKYIMPVVTEGKWKCDDEFPSSDLVDFDPTWNLPDLGE
jgi:hypothetical protein